MDFSQINFSGKDGGTVGFVQDTTVANCTANKDNFNNRIFGKYTLTSPAKTSLGLPEGLIKTDPGALPKTTFTVDLNNSPQSLPGNWFNMSPEEQAQYLRDYSSLPATTLSDLGKESADTEQHLYYPTYNFVGVGDGKVLMCVAQKRYGEIGDFVKIVLSTDNKTSVTRYAIIVEHTENLPDETIGYGKDYYCSSDGSVNRSIELSIVVVNEPGYDYNTWCGSARYNFCGCDYSKVSIATLSTISIAEKDNDNSLITENATSSDFLLKNSEDERKYGINIFETSQPLIRFTTSSALNQGSNPDALKALESYSRFMYALLNSQVSTANYVLVGMPWLRPGFNTWVDPLYSDTVYYISEVQQQGNPVDGATTVVSLIHGRPRGKFVADSNAFGSISDSSDNVFINSMKPEYRVKGEFGFGPWGEYLETADDFKNAKAATQDYYSHEIEGTVAASTSQFHRAMYVDGVKPAPAAENADKTKIFNGEYTAAEIKAKIDAIYASAPAVVKERSAKLKRAVEGARKYINLHYDSEKRV
jgi:hypothetical protein